MPGGSVIALPELRSGELKMKKKKNVPVINQRTRVDKRVFWPQYFRKIEYVCLIGF